MPQIRPLRSFTTCSRLGRAASTPDDVPVDSDCIPTRPTYSLKDYIPPPIDMSIEQIKKLYRLSALEPPNDLSLDHKVVTGLRELAAIVEGVRLASRDGEEQGEKSGQGSLDIVDARVRAPAKEIVADRARLVPGEGDDNMDPDNLGTRLLDLAAKTDGAYFVVPTPENIRGKKRSSNSSISDT
ncbi:hypothetical protein ACM66B_003051 [Microbotryomycetes sp. NB124-2]